MKNYAIIILACILCCFAAYNKTVESGVSIRIQNGTPQDFKKVITNNKSFENVYASNATSYQAFEKVTDLPFVMLVTPDDTAFAGAVYLDPPFTYLASGKYTLKVFIDTAAYYAYNCVYIKD